MPDQESTFQGHGPCPECKSSDAYSIYSDGHAYCFSCSTYFKNASNPEEKEKRSKETANFIFGDTIALSKRGITRDTCAKFSYRVGKAAGQHVQIANYYDVNNNLVAQHLRYPDKTFAWVGDAKKALLFGQHVWSGGGRRLVITEGEIDCLTISQAFKNTWQTVSVPNGAQSAVKAIQRSIEFIESFHEVVIAFDDDEAGRKAAQEVAQLISPGKVKIMTYGGAKDANELLTSGKGHLIPGLVFGAKQYRPDGIINAADLWEEIQAPPEAGLALPYPKLTSMLHGLRAGELVMLTAGSGIGKSTLAHEIGHYLLSEHNQAVGVMALEENKVRATLRYLSIAMNKPLHLTREGVTPENLKAAFDATAGSGRLWLYDHFGSTNLDNLLAKVKYMAIGLGVKWVILDHISIVVSGLDAIEENERRMIDKLMTKLRSLVEETQIGLIGVVHLKRPDKGKSYNEGRQVSLTDLRGSAAIEQLSDTVIALERDQQDPDNSNRSISRVLKNRRVGLCGRADDLLYNPITGRLLATDARSAGPFQDETVGKEDF